LAGTGLEEQDELAVKDDDDDAEQKEKVEDDAGDVAKDEGDAELEEEQRSRVWYSSPECCLSVLRVPLIILKLMVCNKRPELPLDTSFCNQSPRLPQPSYLRLSLLSISHPLNYPPLSLPSISPPKFGTKDKRSPR